MIAKHIDHVHYKHLTTTALINIMTFFGSLKDLCVDLKPLSLFVVILILDCTFLVRFDGISGEFGRAMVRLCPGVPEHRGNNHCTPFFTKLCLAVEHCWVCCISSCEPCSTPGKKPSFESFVKHSWRDQMKATLGPKLSRRNVSRLWAI